MVMQTMRSIVLSTLLLLALAAPATAAGPTDCVAPPGTAAIEEYCETVPSATGDKGGGIRSAQPLDRSTRSELRSQGADGQALAGLLRSDGSAATSGSGGGSVTSKGSKGSGSAGTSRGGAGATQDEPSGNPLHAVTSAVEAGPTLGGGFAWALLGITALMIAAGWMRLRARRD
jgi:hypothetical protein